MERIEEQVLDLAARGCEQAEVFSQVGTETPVAYESNRLKSLQTRQSRGLALRVVVNGRVGLASASGPADAKTLVAAAVEMSRYGASCGYDLPGSGEGADPKVFEQDVADLSVERLVAMGQAMLDRVRAYDANILCDATVSRSVTERRIINSRGADCKVRKTVLSLDLHGNLVRGTDMLDIYEQAASCRADVDPLRLAGEVVRKTEMAREFATSRTGTMPVLFTPKGVAMTLMTPLVMALSGKMVLQGASPLRDKVGQVVADERFSLSDDGTADWSPASGSCDHEGVPCRRTPLVEKGRLEGFYYDLYTAAQAGARSTGNGFRSLESLPTPQVSSLLVAAGSEDYATIVASMEEGLIVDQTMGAWSGNLMSGEFSGNVHLGYKVERGQVVGRVKDTMVAGNVFDALRNLRSVGSEREWMGNMCLPALCFGSLAVATK
jgi:PmbA protein